MPVFASRFVGRKREVAYVSELLQKSRLVTLTGTPGSGKTRLALEVGRQVAETKHDGACLIELAALGEGGLLPETFAAAIGVTSQAGSPLDSLLEGLSDMDCLLVVDNCEHLVEACAALVDRVLRGCRHVSVLATSREPLRIDGEAALLVPMLSVPPKGASLSEIKRSESAQLFLERARQVAPGFALTNTNAAEVASICRRLDGLPLALELAAARTATLDLPSIAEQLDDRFRFLTGGFRTAPPRQRTLRAAIDWSYELLSAAERQLLERAAVFAGSFDLVAAGSVCAGGAVLTEQVPDVLGHLIDKSLVAALDAGSERRRYRLLESLRAYGADRLRESRDYDAVKRKHAQHFAAVAEAGFELADGSWLNRIRLDLDNIREALTWSRGADPMLNLRLAVPFGSFCSRAGFMSEGRAWLEPAVSARAGDVEQLARGNEILAMLAWRQGDSPAADRFASSAVALGRSLSDEAALARLLGVLAFIRIGALRFETVPETVAELLSIARHRADKLIEGEALLYLGLMESHGDDLTRAVELLAGSVAMFEAAGHADGTATQHNVLGWLYLRRHDIRRARVEVATGLKLRWRHHEVADLGSSLDASAELAFNEGSSERAMRLLGAADALRETLGSAPPSLALASRGRWVERAERMLGTKARRAWLEGRDLTLDEAVRYAMAPPGEAPPRAARRGDPALTRREMQIAELVGAGMTNHEIAARLELSTRTVEAHLEHIRTKLAVRSRVEVATWVSAKAALPPASRS